jgi:hypothetical protein
MADNDQFDEVAFNVLLSEGLDVPTSYAASIRDADDKRTPAWIHCVGLIAAIVGLLIGFYLLS